MVTKLATQNPKPVTRNFPQFIHPEIFQNSLRDYKTNNLIKYLKTIFDNETIVNLINIYKIGPSSHFWGGTTIFWQIDIWQHPHRKTH